MQIRRFEPGDKDALTALALRAFAPVYTGICSALPPYAVRAFYPQGWEAHERAQMAALCDDEATDLWMAVVNGAVAGYAGLRRHAEDRMGEVYVIGVDPDRQRQGIARALVDHALACFAEEGLAMAMIETGADPGHAPARKAYEAMGFDTWPAVRYLKALG